MANTMCKFVQLIFWLVVFAYLTLLNKNLDARNGAVPDAAVESMAASQAQGASEVRDVGR